MRLLQISLLVIIIMSFSAKQNSRLVINSHGSVTIVTPVKDSIIHYLALGDSYTAGTSVSTDKSFPSQLATCLQEKLQKEVKLEVIARAGWRTDELINILNLGTLETSYDFVTLLIGVNNHYQKKTFSQYKKDFPRLLKQAIKLANGNPNNVLVVSIPDWAYTPFGEKDGRKNISKEIDKYNVFAEKTTKEFKATFITITDLTRDGLENPALVAKDGLHPSGVVYKHFVERLCPTAISIFK